MKGRIVNLKNKTDKELFDMLGRLKKSEHQNLNRKYDIQDEIIIRNKYNLHQEIIRREKAKDEILYIPNQA